MISIIELSKLEQDSLKRKIPIIGSEKGAWLLQKITEISPQAILELGTANGYSGCLLGSQGADLTTIEINQLIAEEAVKNFSKFNIKAKIIIGDAVMIVKELAEHKQGLFDLIFIDFFKKGYLQVLDNCLKLVKWGGMIIADNINMRGCLDFKQAVLNHPQLDTKIINIRDGLSCSVKK